MNPEADLIPENVTRITRRWIESVVVGLNLCPFARQPLESGRVRLAVSEAVDVESLLTDIYAELELLGSSPEIETTLLIHPWLLGDFHDYNDFLDIAQSLLADAGFEGVVQLASFHPAYQFAGTTPDAAENFSNRSPFPMLHLLREDSVSEAVDRHPDTDRIPDNNIARLTKLGCAHLQSLRDAAFDA